MADIAALEARRREAARLLRKGMSQTQVARLIGVSIPTVNGWAKLLRQGGLRGLRIKRLGRKPRLDERQLRELMRLLKRGPQACGLSEGLWTVPDVALLIQQRFGVTYGRDRILGLLHESGFNPKKHHGWVRRTS